MTSGHRRDGVAWQCFAATLGPVGKCPAAPGTAGSFVGFAAYAWSVLSLGLSNSLYWTLCVLLPLLAVPLCYGAEKKIGKKDPPEVVLDEFAVVPLCCLGTITPSEMLRMTSLEIIIWLVVAFCLFRVFDISKPFGIKASQNLPRGWGIVLDDVLAALCACACLNLAWSWLGPQA